MSILFFILLMMSTSKSVYSFIVNTAKCIVGYRLTNPCFPNIKKYKNIKTFEEPSVNRL